MRERRIQVIYRRLRPWLRIYLREPQWFFLVTALVFGTFVLVMRPGYDVPDFGAQLKRGYDIAQGNFIPDPVPVEMKPEWLLKYPPGFVTMGGRLPRAVVDLTYLYPIGSKKIEAKDQFALYRQPYDPHDEIPAEYTYIAPYNPAGYVVQATGVLVGRITGASVYATVLIISTLNFIIWLAAIFTAIRITPVGKWTMAVLNLLPMTIFLVPSVSIDPFLMATVFFFIAYLLRILKDAKPVTRRQFVVLVLLCLMLAVIKQTLFMVAFLAIALYGLLGPRRHAVLKLAVLIGLPVLVTAVWVLVMRRTDFILFPGTDPDAQLRELMHAPQAIPRILLKSYLFNTDQVVWAFFGVLGWLKLPIPLWSVLLGAMALGYSIIEERGRLSLARWQRWTLAAVFVGAVGVMTMALHVYVGMPGKGVITSLQGRYFIPLVFMLVPVFSRVRRITPALPLNRRGLFVPVATLVVLGAAVAVMLENYYADVFTVLL